MAEPIPDHIRRLYDCELLLHPETGPKRPLTDEQRREVLTAKAQAEHAIYGPSLVADVVSLQMQLNRIKRG